jgi:DNA-binding SARP family transcriptional activator
MESHRECEAEELPLEGDVATHVGVSTSGSAEVEEVAGDEVLLPVLAESHDDEQPTVAATSFTQQWPVTEPANEGAPRAITVQLFGPYSITAYGQPVETGLRRRSKMLLAWYMLRPDGATSEEAIDALWPETAPQDIHKAFWRAVGDLRSRLSDPAHESIEVLSRVGEHYLPTAADIECDLWTFQCALGDAARATDDRVARSALRRATDAYTGDLLVGSDYPWVEPVRRDLHRRFLDAMLRLAEIEDQLGHSESAVAVLEKAIEMDRYAEEPYRRLMTLHAARNRPGTVAATWQLLNSRLGDLDLEVEDATSRLYHSLSGTKSKPARIRHPAKAS